MKIKICGLQNFADVATINQNRPDYAGFVFAESKRQVGFPLAQRLIAELDRNISCVGVYVNPHSHQIIQAAEIGVNVIQLHGDESLSRVKHLRQSLDVRGFPHVTIWKAFSVRDVVDTKKVEAFPADAVLLDGWHPAARGGTGTGFDWKLACDLIQRRRIILAGGLSLENLQQKLSVVSPWAIDVASGAELDGRKDGQRIRAMLKIVADHNMRQEVAV